jgi:hypothetical protein
MIRLIDILQRFESDFLQTYGTSLLPSQRRALSAFKHCRTRLSAQMRVQCEACFKIDYLPHSCGHRSCPHCQAHESQRWIEQEQAKLLPVDYFMLTFTLPKEWRTLVWQHQKSLYDLLIKIAWDTINTFSQHDKTLQGNAGAIAVLHTHNRRLDFHPHVHMVVPSGAINTEQRRWRVKRSKYLFNHKALAKVFRAKMLDGITKLGLTVPKGITEKWVVDCKQVGSGAKAIAYLGRYLYRGVIQEKDILSCDDQHVRFRYIDSKTKTTQIRTVTGVEFLRLLLQHILPKGFRRARNFGFLHPNCKRQITLLQILLRVQRPAIMPTPRPVMICACCGGTKRILQTRIESRCRPNAKDVSMPDVIPNNKGIVM